MKKGLLFLILIILAILAFIFVPKKQDVVEDEENMINAEVMIDGDVQGATDEMVEVSTEVVEVSAEAETAPIEGAVEIAQ